MLSSNPLNRILYGLFLLTCTDQAARADLGSRSPTPSLPPGCSVLDPTHIQCLEAERGIQSGAGKWFGPYHTLTSYAPPGYRLLWSEGHIRGQYDHRCGVRDRGTREPSPNGNSAEHPEVNGHPQGTSYWAICYLAERDDSHVVLKVSLQGIESVARVGYGDRGVAIGTTSPQVILGDADLIAVYVRDVPDPQ